MTPSSDLRTYFCSKLTGNGLEIGGLHRPMPIHENMMVQYVERMPLNVLREHYPELAEEELVEPDILDDAESLSSVQAESADFVIAAHVFEHLRNPIQALIAWNRVLRPGGYLYLVLPDARETFDKNRQRTFLEHFLLDYAKPSTERDLEHFIEYASIAENYQGMDAVSRAIGLAEMDYSIHFHVFEPHNLMELLAYCAAHLISIHPVEGPLQTPGSDEFHVLCRKYPVPV